MNAKDLWQLIRAAFRRPLFVDSNDSNIALIEDQAANLPPPNTEFRCKQTGEHMILWGVVKHLSSFSERGRYMIRVTTVNGDTGIFKPTLMIRLGDVILMAPNHKTVKRTTIKLLERDWSVA